MAARRSIRTERLIAILLLLLPLLALNQPVMGASSTQANTATPTATPNTGCYYLTEIDSHQETNQYFDVMLNELKAVPPFYPGDEPWYGSTHHNIFPGDFYGWSFYIVDGSPIAYANGQLPSAHAVQASQAFNGVMTITEHTIGLNFVATNSDNQFKVTLCPPGINGTQTPTVAATATNIPTMVNGCTSLVAQAGDYYTLTIPDQFKGQYGTINQNTGVQVEMIIEDLDTGIESSTTHSSGDYVHIPTGATTETRFRATAVFNVFFCTALPTYTPSPTMPSTPAGCVSTNVTINYSERGVLPPGFMLQQGTYNVRISWQFGNPGAPVGGIWANVKATWTEYIAAGRPGLTKAWSTALYADSSWSYWETHEMTIKSAQATRVSFTATSTYSPVNHKFIRLEICPASLFTTPTATRTRTPTATTAPIGTSTPTPSISATPSTTPTPTTTSSPSPTVTPGGPTETPTPVGTASSYQPSIPGVCMVPSPTLVSQVGPLPDLSLSIPTWPALPTVITATVTITGGGILTTTRQLMSGFIDPVSTVTAWCNEQFGPDGWERGETDAAPIVLAIVAGLGWLAFFGTLGQLNWVLPPILISLLVRIVRAILSLVKYVKQILPFQ